MMTQILRKYRLVAFDLDGTIVDSMGRFADVAADVLVQEYGLSPDEAREQYRRTSGLPFFKQLEAIFGAQDRHKDMANLYENRKATVYDACPFFPEIKKCFQKLKANGALIAVSSNNHLENVVKKVSDYANDIDLVLGFEPGFFKGEDHFKRITETFDLKREEPFCRKSLKN